MRGGILLLAVSMLAACSPSADAPISPETPVLSVPEPKAPEPAEIQRITDIDFGSYTKDLAKFVKLEIGEPFSQSKAKMEAYFVPGQGIPGAEIAEDRRRAPSEVSFSTFSADGGTVIIAERSEMADDSVRAERMYILTKKLADGSEKLVDYGMKIKCWRGDNPGMWRTNLCP